MVSDRDEQKRQKAYAIWQAEGEPHGRHDEHWAEAERQLTDPQQEAPQTIAAEPQPAAKKPRKAPAKAKAADAVKTAASKLAKAVDIARPAASAKPARTKKTA